MTIDPKIIEKAAKRLFDEDSAWAVASYLEKQYHREAVERVLLAVAPALRAEGARQALLDAADDWHAENAGTAPRMNRWLRDRADRQRRDDQPDELEGAWQSRHPKHHHEWTYTGPTGTGWFIARCDCGAWDIAS